MEGQNTKAKRARGVKQEITVTAGPGGSGTATGDRGVQWAESSPEVHPSSSNSVSMEQITDFLPSESTEEAFPQRSIKCELASVASTSSCDYGIPTELQLSDPQSLAMFVDFSQTSRPTLQSVRSQEIIHGHGYGSENDESEDEEISVWDKRMGEQAESEDEDGRVTPPSVPSSFTNDGDTDLGEYKPTDIFDFQWRAFPETPIPPNLRREEFIDSNSGPRVHYADPYAAFTAIWDRQIMEYICGQTNLYVQQEISHLLDSGRLRPQSRITQWKDIDVDELYVYLAIILAMGVLNKSRIEDYWSTNQDVFITPGFSICMPINRFVLINRWLHFNNNLDMHRVSLSPAQAKLFKVKPIIDHLNIKFSSLYNLGQNITLDESLTQWKGCVGIKHYLSKKAARVGIKTFELCESQSGYLWRFEVYSGSEPSQNSGPLSGTIPATVLRLVKGLEFKGHTLWMDNYYNSPALARTLKSMQIDCVGTLRTNRQFVPDELRTLRKSSMARSEVVGCTSGDVDLLVWRDKSLIALISTYHGASIAQCGRVRKPAIVHDYNLCMGGVDKKDQMLAMFPIERTRVWYKKLFRRLLNISVSNSYIMFHFNTPSIDHHDFRINLVRLLLAHHHPTYNLPRSRPLQPKRRLPLDHLPAEYGLSSGERKSKLRRRCCVCKLRTHTYCFTCDVPLCLFRRGKSENNLPCFVSYHRDS